MPAHCTYRTYSMTAMKNAFQACTERKMPVTTAARQYGVPMSTLRDRVLGRVAPGTHKSGTSCLFTLEEESEFVNHIQEMAELGYVYSRREVVDQATNYAVFLKKRDTNLSLSDKWYRGFVKRWPDMKHVKPSIPSHVRTEATIRNNISMYFQKLKRILKTHKKPGTIDDVDEMEHILPDVVCAMDSTPDKILSPLKETQKTKSEARKRSKLGNTIQPMKKPKSSPDTPPNFSPQTDPSGVQVLPMCKSEIDNSDYIDVNEANCVCNLCAACPAADNILSRLKETKTAKPETTKSLKLEANKSSKLEKTIQLMRKPKSHLFTTPNCNKTGPSILQVTPINNSEIANSNVIDDNEMCCVCNRYQPPELQDCYSVVFTKWAQCDIPSCKHWTHLKYCCVQTVIRRNTQFVCPCHGNGNVKHS